MLTELSRFLVHMSGLAVGGLSGRQQALRKARMSAGNAVKLLLLERGWDWISVKRWKVVER